MYIYIYIYICDNQLNITIISSIHLCIYTINYIHPPVQGVGAVRCTVAVSHRANPCTVGRFAISGAGSRAGTEVTLGIRWAEK